MKFKEILFLIMLICLLNFGSSLKVLNQSVANVNKYPGRDIPFTFNIINDAGVTYFNVSVESNSKVYFDVIPSISPGVIYKVNATLTGDENFNNTFKIFGYYQTQVGASNSTYLINVDFYSGVDTCDMTLIKGDKIRWLNLVNDVISLRNTVTQIDIATIPLNSSYETTFDVPMSLTYYAIRRGYIFTNPCTITALDTGGMVRNPATDTNLSIEVNMIYNPTDVILTVLEDNYTINIFETASGAMSIKNVGNTTAKNIIFAGNWFTFSPNGFDLAVNQSRALTYEIKPVVSNSNDTDKTYIKNITINGNFATLYKDFTIFVPYTNLDNLSSSSNFQSVIDVLTNFCQSHPEVSYCRTEPQTIYVYGNGSDVISANFSQAQIKGLLDYIFVIGDDLSIFENYVKEKFDWVEKAISNNSESTSVISSEISESNQEQKERNASMTFIFIAGAVILVCGMIIFLIFLWRGIQKQREIKRW